MCLSAPGDWQKAGTGDCQGDVEFPMIIFPWAFFFFFSEPSWVLKDAGGQPHPPANLRWPAAEELTRLGAAAEVWISNCTRCTIWVTLKSSETVSFKTNEFGVSRHLSPPSAQIRHRGSHYLLAVLGADLKEICG